MIEQKKNDWLATLFFSPDKTPQDLANLGITTNNSSLQDIDYYKNIPQIQEAFKNESGNFDNAKFDKYYQEVLKLYNDADNDELVSNVLDFYSYDPYDYFAPTNSKVRDVSPKIVQFANPERRSRGLSNLHEISAPTMSLREVAQQSNVFNTETQKFEDWTPNDWGGLSAFTRPTLVMAQWDEDGTHEVNGRIVSHKAGDYKFNENGDPFYETLGNRALTGKDILHVSDTLTIDGSKWNKIDIFDSDGLDKSVSKTIAKTIFKIAPMFIPHVGKFYGGLSAAIELGKLLPALYKSVEGIATGDISTSRSAQVANDIQAYFSRFDGTLSDKGKQGFFNIENIAKIVEDSSLQLFQQRVIGSIPTLFKKAKAPVSENAIKWGRGLALAYMAGTSSIDSYDAFKKAGADDRIAGLGMVSVMLTMFGLMNNDYFKDFWFKDSFLDRAAFRSVIKESADQLTDKGFTTNTLKQISSPKAASKWVMDMKDILTKRIVNMNPNSLAYGAINEGVEETIEEIGTDAVKAFYSGLNTLGIIDKDKEYNFGFTPKDIVSRYAASFVGGAIGGAVFNMHNKWESRHNPELNNAIKSGGDSFKEIIYLLRANKEQALRKELDRLHTAGKLGSTNLSGTEFELVKNGDNVEIQYKAAKKGESQNDLIYKQLNYYIDRINEVIKEEGLDISDAELQYITEQSEITGKTLEQTRQDYINLRKLTKEMTVTEQIVNSGLYSQLFEDWNDLTAQIIQTKTELEEMLMPEETESKTPKDIEDKIASMRNNSEYQQLRIKLDDLRAKRNAIINGEKNDFYTGQLLFAASSQLVNSFVSGFGIHNFTKYKYGKNYDTLTADEKTKVDTEYAEYSSTQEKSRVLTAYDIFTQMQEKMIPSILDVAQRVKDSSGLYIPETTEYKLIYDYTNQIINQKKDELEKALQALPEGMSTTEEIDKLREDINKLELNLEAIKTLKFEVLKPVLSENGKTILTRPENRDMSAFITYASTYKDYLNYINNNNLYLDLVDSDLASILQSWISINNLTENTVQSWINRIQYELNNNGLELEANDPFVEDLASKLTNIIADIKRNDIDAAINNYDYITHSDLIGQAEMLDVNLDELVSKLLPLIGEDQFINYLRDIKTLKSQISSSPAYDLIDAASKVVEADNFEILDLIRSEQINFLNSKAVEDYVIRDKNSLIKLKETKQLINAIRAVLDASVEGSFNTIINPFRQQLQKELLPIITVEADVNLVKDLNRIATQLQTLIDISERNQAQKLREQRDIAINMRSKFINLLVNDSSLIKQEFSTVFGINLEQLRVDFNIPLEVTEENYKELEEAAIKLETAIFKHINASNLSGEDIAQRLIGLFNPQDLMNGRPTKLSKDPDTIITDFDQLMYLATIIATPSQNFYNKLKEIISNPEFTNAPIFSQEYATRVAYSQILNKEVFNSVITQLKDLAEKTSDDQYIKTKSPLYNLISIYGGAGVGKTKGVAYLLKLMLPKASIITCAPTKKQTDNLSRSIQHDETRSLTKNELIEKILGRPLRDNDIKPIGDVSITSDISLKLNSDNIFGDGEPKILFIDEISWYNRIELELISKWARQNNVTVVALGDYKQNASFVIHDNRRIDCGVEDTYVVKTPDLVAPLRPDNIAKYDNYTRLAEALDKVYEQYYNNPAITPSVLNTFTREYLNANKIEFKYFEDANTFGGEKIVLENDIFNYIDRFKRLSEDIAIITDKPEKYNTIKGVKIVALNSVQGDEFDYVIIDKNFGLDDTGKGRGDYYKLKDLYTLSQRSRKGTIIVNSGLGDIFTSKLDQTSAGNIEMPQSQIIDFKNWRISLLENIPEDRISWEPLATSIPILDEQKEVKTESLSTETNIVNSNAVLPEKSSTSGVIADASPATIISNSANIISPLNSTTEPILNSSAAPEYNHFNEEPTSSYAPETSIVTRNDIISTAESYLDFIENELTKYYDNSEYSFKKYLNLESDNPQDIIKLTNLLRSYFVYGYYKTEPSKLKSINNRLYNLAYNINRDARAKIVELMKLKHRFVIIPHTLKNGITKGLLVARFENDETSVVDIPLLIVDPQAGDYYGDIEIASKCKYVHIAPGEDLSYINIENFKSSSVNTFNIFTAFNQPVVLGVEKERKIDFDNSQRDWVFGNSKDNKPANNGRTFFLATLDPFITDTDFRDFLETTFVNTEDGKKITWTTQHNNSIALVGMNWVTDFNTILDTARANKGKKHNGSIINGNRAGQIVGIAYKVAPDIVIKRIKFYLDKSENNGVAIGKDIIYNKDEINTILEKYKDEDINIVLGYLSQGIFYPQQGEKTINEIFSELKFGNFTSKQLDTINDLCNKSPKFIQGIYAQDVWVNTINGIWRGTNLNHTYICNIKSLIGNDFKIDDSKINREEVIQESDLLKKLNSQLADLGFNRIIVDQSKIQSVINDINEEIISSITSPEFEILDFDGNDITTIKKRDIRYMIANYLQIPIDSIQIYGKTISNFVPFYVSLQDQISSYYIAEKKNDEWAIRDFSQEVMTEYNALSEFYRKNKKLIDSDENIKKYVLDLLNNRDINKETAEKYWKAINYNVLLYNDLKQQINKYLMKKLENNEC